MRNANEAEVVALQSELTTAGAGDLEMTLVGPEYELHQVSLRYITRLLDTLQASFRAMCNAILPEGTVRRADATLSLAATSPGSFKVHIMTPSAQLEFFNVPIADQALSAIVDLLESAEHGTASRDIPAWTAGTEEPVVRSMIRFSVALASSKGSVTFRWRGAQSQERLVAVTTDAARALAVALSGESGREILEVTGHLEMGQDQPPRARIRTADDEHLAQVPSEELLERVKDLLFEDVRATLVVDMRTSPTTGSPDTHTELLDIDALDVGHGRPQIPESA
jgi:hypothetical protein